MCLPFCHPDIKSNQTLPALLDSTTPSPMARDQAYYKAENKIEQARLDNNQLRSGRIKT